jgi:hypothetical protein
MNDLHVVDRLEVITGVGINSIVAGILDLQIKIIDHWVQRAGRCRGVHPHLHIKNQIEPMNDQMLDAGLSVILAAGC